MLLNTQIGLEGHVKDAYQCSCLRHWLIYQTQKGSDNSMAVPERGAEEVGDFSSPVHSIGRGDLEELVPPDLCPKSSLGTWPVPATMGTKG